MSSFDWTQLLNPEFYITMSIGGVKVGLWIVLFIVGTSIIDQKIVPEIQYWSFTFFLFL